MKKNILVLTPVNGQHKRLLEERAPLSGFTYSTLEKVNFAQVQEANIIIGNPPIEMIMGSKKLEWLQLNSAGAGEYIKANVLADGVILTNASGAYGLAISELNGRSLQNVVDRLAGY